MKRVKRTLSLLLCVCICIALLPAATLLSSAAEAWLWPVKDCYIVSSNFGLRDLDGDGTFENYHGGIDIIGANGTHGMAIRATKSGTIYDGCNTIADYTFISGSCGNYTCIDHGDGTCSIYMHMQPGNKISGTVSQGETIGYIGKTGESYGSHLHFEIYTERYNRQGSRLNPQPTNPEITINNPYILPSGWSTEKTTYVFEAGPSCADIGSDFYAFIIKKDTWKHVEAAVGGNVQLASSGNNSYDPKQIWHFIRQSDGTYKIQNEYAGKCLDAVNWGTEDGTYVGVGADNGSTAQRWYVFDTGAGYTISPSYCTSLSLDVYCNGNDLGTDIALYTSNGTPAQIFSIYSLENDGVLYSKPARPNASQIMSVEYVSESQVDIDWAASPLIGNYDTRVYDLRVFEGTEWTSTAYFETFNLTGTHFSITLPPGTYTFNVASVNSRYDGWYTIGDNFTTTLQATHTHSYIDVTTPPTCVDQGYTTHTCSSCGESYVDSYVEALGHDWGEWCPVPMNFCIDPRIEDRTCNRCGATESRTLPPDGHIPGEPVKENETAPTCEDAGGYDIAVYCTACGAEISREHTEVAAIGHDWNEPEYVWADNYSTVTATRTCKNDASHKETETVNTTSEVTKPATYEAEGEIVYTATFENEAFATQTKTVATPKLEKPDNPTPGLPCDGGDNCPGNVFADMPTKGNWAHDAIDWAIVTGVTSGTSETTFSPNAGCTRAQVVTFLWRAAGSPEPTSNNNPFTDVTGGYYYKAVLWAVENNITSGTSETTFSPNSTCTRAQIVTFLWRFEGSPAPKTTNNPFTDVKPGSYYEKAVLWASESGVTAGTSATTFSPDATCTRAQVVTFLYRDIEN